MMAIDRAPQVGDRVLITQSGLFDGAEGVIKSIEEYRYATVFHVRLDGRDFDIGLYASEFEVRR
jgi:transcription antitermination factor NusG